MAAGEVSYGALVTAIEGQSCFQYATTSHSGYIARTEGIACMPADRASYEIDTCLQVRFCDRHRPITTLKHQPNSNTDKREPSADSAAKWYRKVIAQKTKSTTHIKRQAPDSGVVIQRQSGISDKIDVQRNDTTLRPAGARIGIT